MFVPSSDELIIEAHRIKISGAISRGDDYALGELLTFFKKYWLLQAEQLFKKDLLTQALVCGDPKIFYSVLHFCADPEINKQIPNFLVRQLSSQFLENVRKQDDIYKKLILKIFQKLLEYCRKVHLRLIKESILTVELCAIMSDYDATSRQDLLYFFSNNIDLLRDGVLCPVILMSILDCAACEIREKQTTRPLYQQERITPMITMRTSLSTLNSSDANFEKQLADIVKDKTYEQLPCFQKGFGKKIFANIQYLCGVYSPQLIHTDSKKHLK
jgi:hypothetical protein